MNHDQQMRQRIALEAARILLEEGIRDFHAAKLKAAARLGSPDTRNLPSNPEVDAAVRDYQRLFHADNHSLLLQQLRETALKAMRLLETFRPRLVGPVLNGSADHGSPVNLHLFADTPEDVVLFLMQQHIPFDTHERHYRDHGRRGQRASYPQYNFVAGDIPLELTVFPTEGNRAPPPSPVDGRPMRRAGIPEVEALLKAG